MVIGWLFGFYGISTFVGYLTTNPLLSNSQSYFKKFSLALVHRFNCQKHFYFKLSSAFKQF